MQKISILLILPLTLAACATDIDEPSESSSTFEAARDDVGPRGMTPIPCCGNSTPALWTNLRVLPQVNVDLPGWGPIYLIAAGSNIDLPCSTTNVDFDIIYRNDGNAAAGPHYNKAYFGSALFPFQSKYRPGLAAGGQIVEKFTRDVSTAAPNVPTPISFHVDWPDGVVETVSSDNSVSIRITRVCP